MHPIDEEQTITTVAIKHVPTGLIAAAESSFDDEPCSVVRERAADALLKLLEESGGG